MCSLLRTWNAKMLQATTMKERLSLPCSKMAGRGMRVLAFLREASFGQCPALSSLQVEIRKLRHAEWVMSGLQKRVAKKYISTLQE